MCPVAPDSGSPDLRPAQNAGEGGTPEHLDRALVPKGRIGHGARAACWAGQFLDIRQIELIKETTLKVADAGNGGGSEKKAAGEEAAAPRVTSDAARERIAAAKARAVEGEARGCRIRPDFVTESDGQAN